GKQSVKLSVETWACERAHVGGILSLGWGQGAAHGRPGSTRCRRLAVPPVRARPHAAPPSEATAANPTRRPSPAPRTPRLPSGEKRGRKGEKRGRKGDATRIDTSRVPFSPQYHARRH